MEPNELTDLRAWAAGVCGYKEAIDEEELWYVHHGLHPIRCVRKEYWLPDQNIAQAMEVLEAVYSSLRLAESEPVHQWSSWSLEMEHGAQRSYQCRIGCAGFWKVAIDESLCMAIVLASFAAHKVLIEVKG